jgi:hypothetical protein
VKTVIEMAREAGWSKEYLEIGDERLERFAAIVREEVYKQDDMTTAYMVGYQAGVDAERAKESK